MSDDEDQNGKQPKTLPLSAKALNWAKAIGAVLTAIAAFSATILSIYLAIRPAPEPVAKATLKAADTNVKALSEDIRKAYANTEAVDLACKTRVKYIEAKMAAFLSGMSHGILVGRSTNEQRQKHRELLETLIEQTKLSKTPAVVAKPAPPPQRKMPTLQDIEQKAAK